MSKQHPSVQGTEPPAAAAVSRYSSRASSSVGSWRPSVFDFRSGGTCPTCHGTGRIPRGQDDELVALIPYSDKRLKPRRRYCVYLSILLVVLLVCGSILLAFMFPRSASISLVAMNTSKEWVPYTNVSEVINITMQTYIHIHNSNFFTMDVQWLGVSLYNSNSKVGEYRHKSVTISPRQDTVAVVNQNATFTGALAEEVWTICSSKSWSHCLSMLAEAEMHYTVLSHTAEAVTSKYFIVSCEFFEESGWTESDACSS